MKNHRIGVAFVCISLMASSLGIVSCAELPVSSQGKDARDEEEELVIKLSPSFYDKSGRLAFEFMFTTMSDTYYAWYHHYVLSRIVPLEFPVQEALDFGPWYAREELGVEDAAEDGSLTRWAKDYYITHDWSEYGQQILTMCPGDTVTVDNVKVNVEDAFDYPKDGYLEEIRDIVGEDTIVIQTCEPSSTLNRIVYGHPTAS